MEQKPKVKTRDKYAVQDEMIVLFAAHRAQQPERRLPAYDAVVQGIVKGWGLDPQQYEDEVAQ